MPEDSLHAQCCESGYSDIPRNPVDDKTNSNKEHMSEAEIRKRLSGRAMEYLMFLDDE